MSTITKEFTKEQLIEKLQHRIAVAAKYPDLEEAQFDAAILKIALASLEAEAVSQPVIFIDGDISSEDADKLARVIREFNEEDERPLAKMARIIRENPHPTNECDMPRNAPAPVSVPAAMEMDDDFDSAFEHGKAVGWNACRAAMLQGADRPQNEPQNIPENIPATQFKPVADLYGLTSPTGGETSFTFDAVEARDFIDGGWSCQEYVELERFQEAVSGNSPVIQDGWVMAPKEATAEMINSAMRDNETGGLDEIYELMIAAAPQQEVK